MQPLPLQLWVKMCGRDFFKLLCNPMTPAALNQIKLDTWGRSRPPGPRSSLRAKVVFSFFFSATLAGGLIDPSNQSWGQHDHDKCGLTIRMDVGLHPKSSCCCQERNKRSAVNVQNWAWEWEWKSEKVFTKFPQLLSVKLDQCGRAPFRGFSSVGIRRLADFKTSTSKSPSK